MLGEKLVISKGADPKNNVEQTCNPLIANFLSTFWVDLRRPSPFTLVIYLPQCRAFSCPPFGTVGALLSCLDMIKQPSSIAASIIQLSLIPCSPALHFCLIYIIDNLMLDSTLQHRFARFMSSFLLKQFLLSNTCVGSGHYWNPFSSP